MKEQNIILNQTVTQMNHVFSKPPHELNLFLCKFLRDLQIIKQMTVLVTILIYFCPSVSLWDI